MKNYKFRKNKTTTHPYPPPHPLFLHLLVLIVCLFFYGQPVDPFFVIIHVGSGLIQQLGEVVIQFGVIYLLTGLVQLVHRVL